jgi:hypothetical protein
MAEKLLSKDDDVIKAVPPDRADRAEIGRSRMPTAGLRAADSSVQFYTDLASESALGLVQVRVQR